MPPAHSSFCQHLSTEGHSSSSCPWQPQDTGFISLPFWGGPEPPTWPLGRLGGQAHSDCRLVPRWLPSPGWAGQGGGRGWGGRVACLLVVLGGHIEAAQEDVGVPQVAVGPPLCRLVSKLLSNGQALRTQTQGPGGHTAALGPEADGRRGLPAQGGQPNVCMCRGGGLGARAERRQSPAVHSPLCGRPWPPGSSPAGNGCCLGCRRLCPGPPGRPAPSPGTDSSWGSHLSELCPSQCTGSRGP